MSTLRNAVQRRNHKERGQLASRERFGLLEKKKDYLLRAKDFHSKEKRLKALREKALFRNPDEFYFKMINTQTKNGVHIQQRNEALPPEMVRLMKSQDKNYIKLQRDLSKKKMEKLKESLHFLDVDEDDEEESEEEAPAKKSNHIVFVDSENDAKNFDPVTHLGTMPELVNRKFNRPRVDTLRNATIAAPDDNRSLKELKRAREMKYKELASRAKREEELSHAERELQIQKALTTKGSRKKVGVDKHGLAVYKWKADRKK
ncbi:UTP11-like, U3 small nucleolar ribonucleoprotein [Apophysomyces sp. BC1034]|nr:UTP11-like, U3 small nucleolar ribonucleoprotein [Apophysomyces sp. BC1015]KAG0180682.1 UTP11-like, U3 small nucleolar ribonucleoprotein [Apophysomyces sp. BC1021]KAG0186670.1 UTP11-like, U3 small nucleolar ribonucleoprotein [Apophysomyces sp. BC1034]